MDGERSGSPIGRRGMFKLVWEAMIGGDAARSTAPARAGHCLAAPEAGRARRWLWGSDGGGGTMVRAGAVLGFGARGAGQDSAAGLSRAPWGRQWPSLSAQAGRGKGDGPRSVTLGPARRFPGAPWPPPPRSWGGGLSCPPNPAPPVPSSAVRAVRCRPVSPRSRFVPVAGRLDGRKRLSWGKRQSRGPERGLSTARRLLRGYAGYVSARFPGDWPGPRGKKRGVHSPRCPVPVAP